MKAKERLVFAGMFIFLLVFNSCDMSLEPYDGMSTEVTFSTFEGISTATNGTYSTLVEQPLARRWYELINHSSDDVSMSGITGDALMLTNAFTHTHDQANVLQTWDGLYKSIYAANNVIDNTEVGQSTEIDQLIGENLYLRALGHLRAVMVWGRPYTQGESNPGIPIMDQSEIVNPPRSTVGEVFEFIVSDLERAVELMTITKNSTKASRETAYALLSRVYLYMDQHERAIEYADLVINSNRYQLIDSETLPTYATIVPENNPETIFAVRFTPEDDLGNSAHGSMYYRSPGGVGWGQMYASESYRNLIGNYPEDVRNSFIQPNYALDDDGNRIQDEDGNYILNERNGFPIYYIMKWSYQQGNVTLSSPIVSRLAEMYLNKAEALAKLGQDNEAIAYVNIIRERAGLSGDALYSTSDLKGHDNVLDVVLEERRLELAWEGHRTYDVFRNNRTLERDYPGGHQIIGSGINVPADDPRVVHYIPQREMILNPNLEQNP